MSTIARANSWAGPVSYLAEYAGPAGEDLIHCIETPVGHALLLSMDAVAPHYEAFAVLAKDYCDLIVNDSIKGLPGLKKVHGKLIRLHTAAMDLPAVRLLGSKTQSLEKDLSHDQWQALYESLKERLFLNDYCDTFDPLGRSTEALTCSLADDFADIWRDLENGFIALKQGQPAVEVWWDWRFSFHFHWGQHSSGALRVMYFALRDEG